ncbi:MAG: CRTAC1 family protein [Bryobacteraceae bacterium]
MRNAYLAALLVCRCLAQPAPLPRFIDVTKASGIRFENASSPTSRKYLPETMTGGVAMFDYDSDGRLDLYFVNGAQLADPMEPGSVPDKTNPRFWNRLYRNLGNGAFADVTEKAGVGGSGYGMGVATGDYDNDGDPDLYVTNIGRNLLFRNNGDGTFRDVTAAAGVGAGGWSTGAVFVDYDGDGKLDLMVARYLEWDFGMDIYCGARKPGYRSYCHPDQFAAVSHLLFRNNGDGTFRDASRQSGIAEHKGKGLGVAFDDYDGDGRPDIVVANDSAPQQLFRNRGDGTFEEVGLEAGIAYDDEGRTFAGMGVDFADYDNDGRPDVFINALASQRYALFRSGKDGFEYWTGRSGLGAITAKRSGWGARMVDYDNDGWKDLLVGQGHVMDNIALTQPGVQYLEPLLLARNIAGRFEDVSRASGEAFQTPMAARGVALGDLDNDGFLDAAINCNNGPAVILRNGGGNGNHWLIVSTVGSRSNRDGMGARVTIATEAGRRRAVVSTGGSYLSASDKRVHFGLGRERLVRRVEVQWPAGGVEVLENVAADQVLTVREPGATQ